MAKASSSQESAMQAYYILNNLVGDIASTVHMYRLYSKPDKKLPDGKKHLTVRLFLHPLLLYLANLDEFYKRYKDVIPAKWKDDFKDLQKIITDKKIVQYRNKFIGHIWDKDLKRPLRVDESKERIIKILEPSIESFLNWCVSSNSQSTDGTVMSVIESVKCDLMKEYDFTSEQAFSYMGLDPKFQIHD